MIVPLSPKSSCSPDVTHGHTSLQATGFQSRMLCFKLHDAVDHAIIPADKVALSYLTCHHVTLGAKAASRLSLLRSALPFLCFLKGCPPSELLAVEGADELSPLTASLLGM